MADFVPVEHQIVVRSLLGQTYGGDAAVRLAAAARETFFPAGKVIYEAGDPPKYLHFILEGRVELTAEGQEPWTFADRGVFGILDAELERPHVRTARAVSDVRVISLRAEDWHDIVEDTFDYTRKQISRNARDLVDRGLSLAPHAGFEGVPVHHRADVVPHAHVVDTDEHPFERLLVLHLADVFERASIQALIRLAQGAKEIALEEGDSLVREGDAADSLYVVASGSVVMEHDAPAISVAFGVHRLVGGYAGLGQKVWPFDVRAVEPTHVIAIKVEELYDVMEDHFDVVRSVMRFLAAERERVQTFQW